MRVFVRLAYHSDRVEYYMIQENVRMIRAEELKGWNLGQASTRAYEEATQQVYQPLSVLYL